MAPALSLVSAAIAVYLLLPVLIIFPVSLTSDAFLTWPPDLASFRWFSAFFDNPAWAHALEKSIEIALPVTVLATVLGTAAALGHSYARHWRRSLQTLFVAPFIIPVLAYALGIYSVAGRVGLVASIWPIVIGQTMVTLPLVFLIVSSGLAGRDRDLPRAAASLGAPWPRVLWSVELPLVRNAILAGGLLSFAYSFDEIVIAYFLSTAGGGTLPVQMLSAANEAADPTIAAASIFVMGVAMTIGILAVAARTWLARTPQ
ncbi:MAG TPA: ABC transporter permease [Thermoleophilaceae bacterium]|nr:ABC transporter permease [Thermoleophilaceae bacterium]